METLKRKVRGVAFDRSMVFPSAVVDRKLEYMDTNLG